MGVLPVLRHSQEGACLALNERTLTPALPKAKGRAWGRCIYCGGRTYSANRVCQAHRDLWRTEFEWLRKG